ncbi:unnamed protein product [Caenorhabditis bovis]|uniref:Cystinosin homolog n=1 Tax=Caenorhabditis bovis TaxID=2654633 RepID=A0A8S1ER39_9PELO|nr:unnamed protein product [Caenorhabditis bovis]
MIQLSIIALCLCAFSTVSSDRIVARNIDYEIVVGSKIWLDLDVLNSSSIPDEDVTLFLSTSKFIEYPHTITIHNSSAHFELTGIQPVSREIIQVVNCSLPSLDNSTCPFDLTDAFFRVSVIRSKTLSWFIEVVGWIYFLAWSVSFYPQIILNFKRKSVVGLNFDFLALNLLGFGAYSAFNLLLFFNEHVKEIYHTENPHSPPPVLTNDVVFAVHAVIACSVTIIQCFIYERENQKVSTKCRYVIIGFLSFGAICGLLTIFRAISILSFVISLSYIKMAITCLKYFPQAIYNYRRKSTVGWSIGNILLDFTGGTLDIFQMVLQALNFNDWGGFYGNPVKFGLGLVSIVFDIVFIIQHYILYRGSEVAHNDYSGVTNPEAPPQEPQEYGSLEQPGPIIVDDD